MHYLLWCHSTKISRLQCRRDTSGGHGADRIQLRERAMRPRGRGRSGGGAPRWRDQGDPPRVRNGTRAAVGSVMRGRDGGEGTTACPHTCVSSTCTMEACCSSRAKNNIVPLRTPRPSFCAGPQRAPLVPAPASAQCSARPHRIARTPVRSSGRWGRIRALHTATQRWASRGAHLDGAHNVGVSTLQIRRCGPERLHPQIALCVAVAVHVGRAALLCQPSPPSPPAD
jgi:hypothetical protein